MIRRNKDTHKVTAVPAVKCFRISHIIMGAHLCTPILFCTVFKSRFEKRSGGFQGMKPKNAVWLNEAESCLILITIYQRYRRRSFSSPFSM